MGERIFVGVAWPYAYSTLHLGHQVMEVGADTFARYHRLKGNDVLMVSGADCHGTPITLEAQKQGREPADLAGHFYEEMKGHFEQLGVSYDLFTHTMTPNHQQTTQQIFLSLVDNGYIFKNTMAMHHCTPCKRFLPDRYVLGTCPHCAFDGARGDQCDECGRQLNPTDLKEPRCATCHATPEMRETEHFFLDQKKLAPKIGEWFEAQAEHMRPNVVRFTRNLLKEVRERPITRDIDWGVPVPLPGFDDKRIYVWFDAVIGYLSASKQWASEAGDPDAWKKWWHDDSCRQYYFLGKDNIVFHTIIWPGMLLGSGAGNLPYDVPANEFLTVDGEQFSKSRGVVIKIDDFLDHFQVDAFRFYVTCNGPETSDSSFTWPAFQHRVNDELIGKWGNLAHRTLHFACNKLDGAVPPAGDPGAEGVALLAAVDEAFERVGGLIEACRFKEALNAVMEVASKGNVYIDRMAPWKQIKTDRTACERTIHTCLQAIHGLVTLTAPFCPLGAARLHGFLGFDDDLFAGCGTWKREPLPGGQKLRKPEPVFTKIEDATIEAAIAQIG